MESKPEIEESFSDEKQFNIKLHNSECAFIISSSSNCIKLELKPFFKCIYYKKIFSLEDLIKINKIFVVFDSIEVIRKSFQEIIEKDKYSIQQKSQDIEIILKVQVFEKIIDISLILEKQIINQEILNEKLYEEIQSLKEEIEILKQENKELKKANETFSKEIEKVKSSENLLFELNAKVMTHLNNIFYDYRDRFSFKFLKTDNYAISYNGLIATKLFSDDWKTSVIGDNEIPENRLSHWKIRINKMSEKKDNKWHILIGVGPNYDFSNCFHRKCWSFICGKCQLCLRQEKPIKYNDKEIKSLKNGDIVEVIIDRTKGELSFKVNDEEYGIAAKDIPKVGELFPFISLYEEGQIVEIL